VSLSTWLRLGWLAVAADFLYWIWELRQPEEQQLSSWHADLNVALYYGGALLFVALLLVSYVAWRVNQRHRSAGESRG
jgi:cytochrome c-type biogenesis protein CcmH/NrfG